MFQSEGHLLMYACSACEEQNEKTPTKSFFRYVLEVPDMTLINAATGVSGGASVPSLFRSVAVHNARSCDGCGAPATCEIRQVVGRCASVLTLHIQITSENWKPANIRAAPRRQAPRFAPPPTSVSPSTVFAGNLAAGAGVSKGGEGHVWGCAAAGTAAALRAAKVVRVRALRGASERLFVCAGPVPRSCARCMLRVPDADATRLDLPRTPSAHLPCATRRQLDTLDQNDWLVGSVMSQNRCSAAFGGPCAADTDGSSATATTGPASP